jgi:hypothetical protein
MIMNNVLKMMWQNEVVAHFNAQSENFSRLIDGKHEESQSITGSVYYYCCYHYYLQLGHVILMCGHHWTIVKM